MATAASLPLTRQFRAAGRELHTASDALVNARLVALFANRHLYGKALGCFYLVHKCLDKCLQRSMSHSSIKKLEPMLTPLYRTEAFEKDLEFYLGPSWRDTVLVTPEIQAYLDHLEALASGPQPHLLLAHSYTQHLAVLSGGQIIRGLARKGMGLPKDQGTAAFEYQGKVGNLRGAYVDGLDSLGEGMDEAARQQMVDEHRAAHAYNNTIIRTFRMGYLAPIKAMVLLVPASAWVALAALVVGAVAVVGMISQPANLPGSK